VLNGDNLFHTTETESVPDYRALALELSVESIEHSAALWDTPSILRRADEFLAWLETEEEDEDETLERN